MRILRHVLEDGRAGDARRWSVGGRFRVRARRPSSGADDAPPVPPRARLSAKCASSGAVSSTPRAPTSRRAARSSSATTSSSASPASSAGRARDSPSKDPTSSAAEDHSPPSDSGTPPRGSRPSSSSTCDAPAWNSPRFSTSRRVARTSANSESSAPHLPRRRREKRTARPTERIAASDAPPIASTTQRARTISTTWTKKASASGPASGPVTGPVAASAAASASIPSGSTRPRRPPPPRPSVLGRAPCCTTCPPAARRCPNSRGCFARVLRVSRSSPRAPSGSLAPTGRLARRRGGGFRGGGSSRRRPRGARRANVAPRASSSRRRAGRRRGGGRGSIAPVHAGRTSNGRRRRRTEGDGEIARALAVDAAPGLWCVTMPRRGVGARAAAELDAAMTRRRASGRALFARLVDDDREHGDGGEAISTGRSRLRRQRRGRGRGRSRGDSSRGGRDDAVRRIASRSRANFDSPRTRPRIRTRRRTTTARRKRESRDR